MTLLFCINIFCLKINKLCIHKNIISKNKTNLKYYFEGAKPMHIYMTMFHYNIILLHSAVPNDVTTSIINCMWSTGGDQFNIII